MNTFVLKRGPGMAVVNADSPQEAFEFLKEYEGDAYLIVGASPDDFEFLPKTKGVVAYTAS